MAQIVPGQIIGNPGAVGPGQMPIGIFYGDGAPTASTNNLILNARVGSLYTDYVNGNLWYMAAGQVWTQISIP